MLYHISAQKYMCSTLIQCNDKKKKPFNHPVWMVRLHEGFSFFRFFFQKACCKSGKESFLDDILIC